MSYKTYSFSKLTVHTIDSLENVQFQRAYRESGSYSRPRHFNSYDPQELKIHPVHSFNRYFLFVQHWRKKIEQGRCPCLSRNLYKVGQTGINRELFDYGRGACFQTFCAILAPLPALEQGLTFSLQVQMVSVATTQLCLQHKRNHRQYANKWAQLCSNKTLFRKNVAG